MDYRENQRRENFNNNFEAFQKLEQMQREDINLLHSLSMDRVYQLATNKSISNERLSEYRKLMKQAGIEFFGYVWDEPAKRMVRFNKDIDLVDLGYVYMEYPPPKFFNKRSECQPILPSQSCYILLRKNWYMYSERFRLKQ